MKLWGQNRYLAVERGHEFVHHLVVVYFKKTLFGKDYDTYEYGNDV